MKLIVDIVNHIEDHLEDDISVESVSSYSGYSPHHFQKMFAACVGMSLGSYLRRRRLTKAAQRLVKTQDRIIDIALSSGFDSQEAFTRAFKSMFFSTPKQYRDRGPQTGLRAQPPICDAFIQHLNHRGVDMEPRFEEKREFYVIGIGRQFERGKTEDIGNKLWPELSKRFNEIQNKKGKDQNGHVTYGVCQEIWIDGQIQDHFRYFAAVEVEPGAQPPTGMDLIKIERQNYAIFTHRTGLQNLEHTNQYIWGTWLPQSGYVLSSASDLEVYPSDFNPPEHEVPFEIWVPVA